MHRDDARRRIDLQATDEERRKVAAWVVDNAGGSCRRWSTRIAEIWTDLEQRARRRGRPSPTWSRIRARSRARSRERNCLTPPVLSLRAFVRPRHRPGARRRSAGGDRRARSRARERRPFPDAAGDHRLGQELHDRERDRRGAAAHAASSPRTSRSPRSSRPSSGSCSRRTGSSTSSATTTTTSPRPTSRRPTRTSRRTARSTTRSTGCATRPRARCSPAAT